MADFMICFFLCNIFIISIIGLLFLVKRIFKNSLSSRMQYDLWFLLLLLLTVPFLPFRPAGFPQLLSWIISLHSSPLPGAGPTMREVPILNLDETLDWMNDFTLSVNSRTTLAADSPDFWCYML